MSDRPMLVAAGVIIVGDRVLLTQRLSGTHLGGTWEFPGGKLEPGEAPEEALRRELHEEIGVEVEVGDALDITFWRYERKSVLLIFFPARITRGDVKDIGVAAHRWASLVELDALEFPPADRKVLEKVRAILGAAARRERQP